MHSIGIKTKPIGFKMNVTDNKSERTVFSTETVEFKVDHSGILLNTIVENP